MSSSASIVFVDEDPDEHLIFAIHLQRVAPQYTLRCLESAQELKVYLQTAIEKPLLIILAVYPHRFGSEFIDCQGKIDEKWVRSGLPLVLCVDDYAQPINADWHKSFSVLQRSFKAKYTQAQLEKVLSRAIHA
ncbi:hypothetical protein F5984_13165 [Rudanella paleaurantiibacter]|uniref:Uncharacterized protein n=1 Tax=Rudanella paleaurantiibacter TaxID=2614655 RepID=A0A7J5TYV1_9BACT|nr:hypothetical protein [Rudanella paleaurantiibacter]KAB7730127.1 hypothetical protein F5984_13165 [Rudanella paleaurantiibacter]